MTYKPNAILDGMTREEALACLLKRYMATHSHDFVYAGIVYSCPEEIGIGACLSCVPECGDQWTRSINAYYDAKEAASKPRWVEPFLGRIMAVGTHAGRPFEMFWCTTESDVRAEIARTNARRKIEAFINQNGGGKDYDGCYWEILYSPYTNEWYSEKIMAHSRAVPGSAKCATRELADAVIEKYSAELRLLIG